MRSRLGIQPKRARAISDRILALIEGKRTHINQRREPLLASMAEKRESSARQFDLQDRNTRLAGIRFPQ